MSLWLSGIGVSRGIAIAAVHLLRGADPDTSKRKLEPAELDSEVARFEAAQQIALEQLMRVRERIPAGTPGDIAAFIDTHLLMLKDRSLVQKTIDRIRREQVNAEFALKCSADALGEVFDQMEDPYLRARREDVEHVVARVQRALAVGDVEIVPERGAINAPAVVVSDDITPADVILLAQESVAAFVTEFGGPLSHTAILARSLGIPYVVGLHGARRLLRDGEQVIVDGQKGQVLASPDAVALAHFRSRLTQLDLDRKKLQLLRHEPARSLDGVDISLRANVELPEDLATAELNGADGVGLYRTEFLFMNRPETPGEDEQYEAYAKVVAAARGPVTMRTLDLGADKQVDSGQRVGPTPNNPALGLRAIRLCLREPGLFRHQVRALLRASAHGEVRIMLPMISSLSELRQAKGLITQCRDSLASQGFAMSAQVPIGIMIEVPAAAIAAPLLAREVDFFSIGTNDLIQYTLAIDRVDDEVNYLYDPLHPAVLRLISMAIEAGRNAGIDVAMCGEMAGDSAYTQLLLGLGLTEFSMLPGHLLEVKQAVRQSTVSQLKAQVQNLFAAADADEFDRLLKSLMTESMN